MDALNGHRGILCRPLQNSVRSSFFVNLNIGQPPQNLFTSWGGTKLQLNVPRRDPSAKTPVPSQSLPTELALRLRPTRFLQVLCIFERYGDCFCAHRDEGSREGASKNIQECEVTEMKLGGGIVCERCLGLLGERSDV